MKRKNTPVDFTLLQKVINEKSDGYNGGQTDFIAACVASYNLQTKAKITASVFRLRWKSGRIKIACAFTRTRKPLTDEHKAKLKAGRDLAGVQPGRQKRDFHGTPYADRMKERFAEKPIAVDKCLSGSMSSAIALMCWSCMGQDGHETVDAIRECTAFACPLFNFRPYKPKPVGVADEGANCESA